MKFESYIFKPNPKKVKEDNINTLLVVVPIIILALIYVFFFRGFFTLLIFGGMAYSLIQIKINDNKKKGASRFGSLVERFTLTPDMITIGDKQFKVDELENLEIDVEDFLDRSNDFFSKSAGTNNFIEFTYKGAQFTFQFYAKRSNDIKIISEIYKEMMNFRNEPS